MPVIQLVGWTYLFICFCLSTFHLFTSFSLLPEQQLSRATDPLLTAAAVDWDQVLFQRYQQSSDPVVPSSQFNEITPQIRLSKMFSKSVVSQDLIRPYWFTSSIQPSKEALTLTTVVEWKELEALVRLAQVYEGPISATLIVPCVHNLHHEQTMQQLNTIRQWYETTVVLRRYVDLHLFLQPGGMRVNEEGELEETPGQGRGGGGYQKARNIARFFSRTDYVAMVPVTLLWMTQIGTSFRQHLSHLKAGDVLVLPTFGFPSFSTSSEQDKDRWPTDRQSVVEWVEAGEMGLLDENYELNNGPTSFITWRDAREPYRVPHYDYKYGPIFISTRLNHPWCEERFEDYLASCVYSIYLSGANLWVLPNDYAVSETVDRKETWTPQQRKIQQKLASKYRMEQCVFYARQFDQLDIFQTERAEHVRQECSKALLNLQKQKMISNVMKAERPSF
ncbi:hypothetical protein BDF20DRAFT_898960 [Mycotypha africana]|uniref:uncharacterized protein n=1 Tax=Mycotypha africana TaxID=64632 RepID=UPI0022FFE775|nr:uncharacterized protein BDF20DRAFT_898960 [Mycotypha africana]KAI8967739.1 hypothetical protein BDF20DRAFT_898960 [Mycotypha africana]